MRVSHIPLRLTAGAFILNSGLSHMGMDAETAKQLHGMAASAYPAIGKVDHQPFGQALAVGEVALGAGLLVPVVPSWLIGAALAGFSGSLLGMYARTPSVRQEGSLRPNSKGIALAKDSWLAGIAVALVMDGITSRFGRRRRRRSGRKVTRRGLRARIPWSGERG